MIRRIDLDHLRIFYEIAKVRSYTKAGKHLNISQSALSKTIMNFEDRLGYKLFERTGREIGFTVKGEKLYKFACRMVEEADQLIRLLDENNAEPEGELKILTTPYLGASWLPRYLPGFIAQYPNMRITIVNRLDNIDPSQADVVIRTAIPHAANLVQRPLKAFHSTLWASPTYLKSYGVPKSAEELDNHRLLTFGGERLNPYGNVDWILNIGASVENPRTPFMQNNSYEGLINLANQDLGIIEIPVEYLTIRQHNLVQVFPDLKGPVIETYYIYPEQMKASKRITALADYLEKKLAEEDKSQLLKN